ncbi:DNA invertase Pin-like site-specific DNA recombinase [Paenibacillus cellulosilyticus]|uniref:DNA invertase Pin-like site-specific DNA recombinase n=1 Tax=Paenibacillus cellulosilyticus TaxID=375489 RepID=A0A2V2Z139_9BACL|nr:recombinase family protein [Paenibacillus cellulosilyticus]PWW08795.1 DNA invertase Pin-like site-specific DNA recombinase [Paenibacillus cellulosilyticus]QKS48347.1 recombinase family protein [Paenibacillus cellulosilyticus]
MKVAIYVRVSTQEQAKDGYSIDAQTKLLTQHFTNAGYEIYEVYKDEGYSGKDIKGRPAMVKLLEDSNKGLFDTVAVWKVTRLARVHLHTLQILETFEKNNIKFFSLSDENIDASTPIGKAMFHIMGTFAEFERNQIIENVKMGMNERAEQGKWNGGSVLGYKSENKKLVIIDDEANIVRRVFDLYVNGKGYKAIANQLNRDGYKTKQKNDFAIATVRTIITNPLYAGFIRFNQHLDWTDKRRKGVNKDYILVKGEHDAIIPPSVWDAAVSMNKISHINQQRPLRVTSL